MATTYRNLANSEKDFDNILTKIKMNVNRSDRIHKAYTIVRKLADLVYGNGSKGSEQRWKAHNEKYPKGESLQALLDIREVANFIPFLGTIERSVLRLKMEALLKGSMIRGDESELNNKSVARNTQFELFLFSHLCLSGYEVEICEHNPDIKVTIGSRVYFIECKRILRHSDNSVNSNVKTALRQLNSSLVNKDDNHFGIVAISVQRILSKPEDILNSKTPDTGLKYVQELTRQFIEENNASWQNSNRLKNNRIASVWVHYSGGVVVDSDIPLWSLSNTTMTNAWRDSRSMDIIEKDFANMQRQLRLSNLA